MKLHKYRLGRNAMKWLSKKIFYTLGITLLCGGVQAQSLAEAKKLYDEGKYAEAKPAFEKLVKQSPGNPSYNLWYGVCAFETGDLKSAEKHLKVATKRKVQDAYKYLASVYMDLYQFDESAALLEDYIDLLAKKKLDTEGVEVQLDIANNAHRMMEKVEDVQIIDSIVIDKNDFLSAYILSEESGSLEPFQQFFQTGQDINSAVYQNQKGDKIYYARPTDENQYCLFTQSMLMDTWGDEVQLPMNVNSGSDDNYPFVLSDGVTMYFASKGNGSIGGYDLFVTRYNINSNTYLAPEQLGMPFNSPYNDYMIVFDDIKGLGWFVSDRNQPEDKVCVYLFIPNPDHKRVESEDLAYKRERASISSIKDTWLPDANYTELIDLSHKEIPYGEKKIQKDFVFPVGNQNVYYTLDQFNSPEARSFYEKVVSINKQIAALNEKLNTLRSNYRQASGGQKEQLKSTILQAETALNQLMEQPADLEKKARNAELRYLNK